MKKNIVYGLIFVLTMALLTACGTDNKENPPNGSPYSFFNATTPLTITKSVGGSCSGGAVSSSGGGYCFESGTSCTSCGNTPDSNTTSSQISKPEGMFLSVQLLKNGLVAPGELVQITPFTIAYGAIVNQYAVTDVNGRAMFEYEAPTGASYDALVGKDITIKAVFLNPKSTTSTPDIEATQDFVLQFR